MVAVVVVVVVEGLVVVVVAAVAAAAAAAAAASRRGSVTKGTLTLDNIKSLLPITLYTINTPRHPGCSSRSPRLVIFSCQ